MGRTKTKISLNLYMNNVLIGTLTKLSNGALELRYERDWVESKNSIPLSLSLPLGLKKYSGDVVINYLDNLLPDNEGIRKALAQRMALDTPEVFDLLAAIGRDCVGAVQLVPEDEPFPPTSEVTATPISSKKIADVLRSLKNYPLGVRPDDDFRISIAGAQEKTAFLKVGSKWNIPKGATPSSHIFKVQMGMLRDSIDMTHSVENEWLCLKICEAYGLPTAKAEIEDFDGVRALVVERFDRELRGKKLLRYAQEDFCQICGIPSHKKYQVDGGPGIRQIMEVLTNSDNPTTDKSAFLKSQIVFWLLAAIDGHAKNFSVFLVPGGIQLTPLYDVMSAHPPMRKGQIQYQKAKLAMSVGNNRHYKIKEIGKRHWIQVAKTTKFPLSQLHKIIDEVVDTTPQVVSSVRTNLPKKFPEEVAEAILSGVREQLVALTKT